jgi:hypothetical protein
MSKKIDQELILATNNNILAINETDDSTNIPADLTSCQEQAQSDSDYKFKYE